MGAKTNITSHQKQQRTCHEELGAFDAGQGLDNGGRRTNEEAQLGNGALALCFIRKGKSFHGMEDQKQVNRYRGRIRMN
jgi:hypothetical protein